jgi:hypothetical protein
MPSGLSNNVASLPHLEHLNSSYTIRIHLEKMGATRKLVKPCTLRHVMKTTYHSSPNRSDIMVTSLHLSFLSISPTTGAIRTNHGPGSQDKARLTFYAKVPVLPLGQVYSRFSLSSTTHQGPWRTYLENPASASILPPCFEEAQAQAQSSVIGRT